MFTELLNILQRDFAFPSKENLKDHNIISLTTKRVLLSIEFDEFFDFLGITSKLQEKIYELYYNDDKAITEKIDTTIFNEIIFQKINLKDEFYVSKYWQYDLGKNILRKNSEQMIAPAGRFYEKNTIESYQEIIETKINNAELLLTRYKYKSEEENFENFNWFYGKQPQLDGYTIRFYFNIKPDSDKIANLINQITDEFDKAGVPFIFKYLSDPIKFNGRTDCAVLYAPRKNALLVFDLVRIIYENSFHESFYCENSPLFTEKLARGLSFGENPDDRRYTSFGSYRSIYVAMAIVKYFYIEDKKLLPNENDLKILLNTNLRKINDSTIKNWTDEFYLNQYSKYNYRKEIQYFKRNIFKHRNSSNRENLPVDELIGSNDYLDCAYLIAQIISREAHFYPSQKEKYYMHCNWISYNATSVGPSHGKDKKKQIIGYEFKALDNSFLEGRLGVAYFLKQLFKVRKDQNIYRIFYRTFQGAIESLIDSNSLENNLFELKWFYEKSKDNLLNRVRFTYFLRNLPEQVSPVFNVLGRNKFAKLHELIDKVVTQDYDLNDDAKNIISVLINDLKEDKPFTNFHGNEEMCLSMKSGYALLGYFFLRLYDKTKFSRLPFVFVDK